MARRRTAALLVAVAALAILAVFALAGGPASSAPKGVAAKRPAIVAHVTGLSGHRLYVKRQGKLVQLHRGGSVALHELLVLGPATKAKFRLRVPPHAGIRPTTDILDLARYSSSRAPKARRITKQYGVIAAGVSTHHTLRLQPHLIEFAP